MPKYRLARLSRKFYFQQEIFWRRILTTDWLRKLIFAGITALIIFTVIMLYGMIFLTNSTNLQSYEWQYNLLRTFNIVILIIFALIIVGGIGLLFLGWYYNRFGSRFLLKLVCVFAVVSGIPGLSVYFIANKFVARTIDSWFEVEMSTALEAGVELGKFILDAQEKNLVRQVKLIQKDYRLNSESEILTNLPVIKRRLQAQTLIVWDIKGAVLTVLGDKKLASEEIKPLIEHDWSTSIQTELVGIDDDIKLSSVTALFQISTINSSYQPSISIKAIQAIEPALVQKALVIQEAQRKYQELTIARDGLKSMYVAILTLSLFLAVFIGLILAVLLSNSLMRPLLWLADGVNRLRLGNLQEKQPFTGNDELSVLTKSFVKMTKQLSVAQQQVKQSILLEQQARASLQIIIDSMSSGVIVMDANFIIQGYNPAAEQILNYSLAQIKDQSLTALPVEVDFVKLVLLNFASKVNEQTGQNIVRWQDSLQLADCEGELRQIKNIVLRGVKLADARYLLVFEDVTKEVTVQRTQAWAEVARRLAHEIKNPLTPIRLAAERLQLKLTNSLVGKEQSLLDKSTKTIVDQVDAMSALLNEFRDYARLPAAKLELLDLNKVLTEVWSMYEHERPSVVVQCCLAEQPALIMGDPQQLRQVIHNLLQNAQDAALENKTNCKPQVKLRIDVFLPQQEVCLMVADSGAGFPDKVLQRMFEPYVTTKQKGTGLGLPMVKKIIDEHEAKIIIKNNASDKEIHGAVVSVVFKLQSA